MFKPVMEKVMQAHSRKVNMIVASECLRNRLHCEQPAMIKDRRYHLRVYQTCFVGRELVDWLIDHLEASNRYVAVKCMGLLLDNGIIHHVCDDHHFKDQMLFYRFRRDDGSGTFDRDSEVAFQCLDLYHRILSDQRQFVLQDIHSNGRVFKTCFIGRRLVDWLLVNGEVHSRENGVDIGMTLLRCGLIKQLSTGEDFQDNGFYYQFVIEDINGLKLIDALDMNDSTTTQNQNTADLSPMRELRKSYDDMATLEISESKEINRRRQSSFETPPNTPPSPVEDNLTSPRPVVLRNVSVKELEDRRNPYVTTRISVMRDAVGYGFVLRGRMPVYVQTVDPNGPGAAAGVKIRQYVYSVNGKNVLRWSHQQVAEEILNSPKVIELVMMNHFRGS